MYSAKEFHTYQCLIYISQSSEIGTEESSEEISKTLVTKVFRKKSWLQTSGQSFQNIFSKTFCVLLKY